LTGYFVPLGREQDKQDCKQTCHSAGAEQVSEEFATRNLH